MYNSNRLRIELNSIKGSTESLTLDSPQRSKGLVNLEFQPKNSNLTFNTPQLKQKPLGAIGKYLNYGKVFYTF